MLPKLVYSEQAKTAEGLSSKYFAYYALLVGFL